MVEVHRLRLYAAEGALDHPGSTVEAARRVLQSTGLA